MNSVKALIGLVIVVGGVYLGFQFIPPYFSNYQLKDDIQTLGKFAPVARQNDEDVRKEVLKKAKGYDIPLMPEQVRISREDNVVIINVDYTRTVDLIGGKQVVLEFHDTSR